MAQLRQDYQKYVERDTEVMAIGPEDARIFTRWWQHKMPFIGIPDPKHVIAGKLYSQKSKLFKGGRLPALVVIDKNTKIRLMHYADSPSDIPSNEEILSLLETLNKENGHTAA